MVARGTDSGSKLELAPLELSTQKNYQKNMKDWLPGLYKCHDSPGQPRDLDPLTILYISWAVSKTAPTWREQAEEH